MFPRFRKIKQNFIFKYYEKTQKFINTYTGCPVN